MPELLPIETESFLELETVYALAAFHLSFKQYLNVLQVIITVDFNVGLPHHETSIIARFFERSTFEKRGS